MAHLLCPVLIGRDEELAAIGGALSGVADGRGECLVLSGEPGIGKSRLAREATIRATEAAIVVAVGRAVPSSTSGAFRPLTEAVLQLLRERALPDDAAFAPWLPALGAILPGVATTDRPASDASAAVRGEALLQLLRRVAPEGALVVLEDLHWADPDTVSVVEYLADNVAAQPILLVLTLRDAPPSPALALARRQRGRKGLRHIRLARLDSLEMAAMVQACVDWADAQLVDRVQQTADGVPLLVEEVLASPGLPHSFAETVGERMSEFSPAERRVLEAAAVLGRQFDWELLSRVTGEDDELVSTALGRAVECLLLTTEAMNFSFRHALTREAVLAEILPPAQRALAASGLAALDAQSRVTGQLRDLAADLAERAGDHQRAGVLLAEAGNESLARGALATAVEALRRAANLLQGSEQVAAERRLVEALALAGRVDEAVELGGRIVAGLGHDPVSVSTRVDVHVRLAQAAIAASRWDLATYHTGNARALASPDAPPALDGRIGILEAEVCFAADDFEAARSRAVRVLDADGVDPEVRCQAFEIVGRSERLADLESARATFERALATATDAGLTLWRMRALHELGTIDMFDHAGSDKIFEARRMAVEVGALSTIAVLDLQLGATYTCRWTLEESDSHSLNAITIAERLGLKQVRAKACTLLAGTASMRLDREAMERWIEESRAGAPNDLMVEGLAWGGRGILEFLGGDTAAAVEPWQRGMALFARLPHGEPAALRALWPAVLGSLGDRRAASAIDEARRLGVSAFHLNRGLIGYAEAMLAGRAGDRRRADELIAVADRGFVNCGTWPDVVRLCAAPAAIADGWGDPRRWLSIGAERLAAKGLHRLAERSRELLATGDTNPWAGTGVTVREADVLRLVIEGRANKEIAALLHLSTRTVEKHVESLLRKTGARSRTELAVAASRTTSQDVGAPRART